MIRKEYDMSLQKPFDHSCVKHVKRIVVGSPDPSGPQVEAEAREALALLNRCLSEAPAGRIMGTEKSFRVINEGEIQIVVQWLVYHVGFERKPLWLE